jgi:hypothetical protein
VFVIVDSRLYSNVFGPFTSAEDAIESIRNDQKRLGGGEIRITKNGRHGPIRVIVRGRELLIEKLDQRGYRFYFRSGVSVAV